jgi:hypothetical protein
MVAEVALAAQFGQARRADLEIILHAFIAGGTQVPVLDLLQQRLFF